MNATWEGGLAAVELMGAVGEYEGLQLSIVWCLVVGVRCFGVLEEKALELC